MNAGKFWLLMFLAVIVSTLIILEILCESQVYSRTALMSYDEAKVGQARQQNELLRQLVQKVAIESQRDPALLDLLAKRGVRLNRSPNATGPTPLPAAGAPPSSPTPAPQ